MNTFREQIRVFLRDRKVRSNIRSLATFLVFLSAIIVVFTLVFLVLMAHEGRQLSFVTGLYWTLNTMSTLGYGDVTFYGDLGRAYSILVLSCGLVTLFIVLPFTFIRYFYAPWMELQTRLRTPRAVPPDTRDHVIVCAYDPIAPGFVERLSSEGIPHFVIEPDVDKASELHQHGIPVVVGDVDDESTYRALQVAQARMVFANCSDAVNTTVTLTVRNLAEETPIAAVAHEDYAIEILRRSGASHVLPLNRWLGEQLANRINARHAAAHVIGEYYDLQIAELPVHQTPLVGKTIRETQLRENTGVSIVGVWERGKLHPPRPEMKLTDSSVPVVMGTEQQVADLDMLLMIYDVNENPVIVVGGGSVGTAAARALKRKEVASVVIERDPTLCTQLKGVADNIVEGDAFDPDVLIETGIREAPSVIVTTSDDATNIFLVSQCRRLNDDLRIVSRVTHERNIEAIHAAGADFVLGSAELGIEATLSILKGKEMVMLGEGVELFSLELPATLRGKSLAESDIGARTGLTVIAVQQNGEVVTNPPASTTLNEGVSLIVLGDTNQRREFDKLFTAS